MADHTTRGATPASHVSTAGALRADIDRVLSAHQSGPAAAPHPEPAAADPLLPGLDTSRPLDVLLHKLELLRSALLGFRLAARSFEHRVSAAEVQETFGGMFEALWALMPGVELTEAAYGVALDLNDTASTGGAPVPPAAGGFFGLADDNAVIDVACGRAIIRKRTGLVANTLFARADVLARVANSAAVRSYLPAQAEPATTLQMEAIFGVQRITIVDSLPTDLGSNSEAIGNGAVLAYLAADAAAVPEAAAKQGQRARKQTGQKAVKAPARKAALSHA